MLGIVLADRADVAASVVAARTWREAVGAEAMVLAAHPELVPPLSDVHEGRAVRSWADLGTPSGRLGAALATIADERAPEERIVVLPPTAFVLAPPEALLTAGTIGLVPRAGTIPPDDGRRPSPRDVAGRGAIHDGLFAFSVGETAFRFLEWWDAVPPAVRRGGAVAVPGTELLADPGTGVGWWNLHARPLGETGGRLTAGGAQLCIADLEGWRFRHRHVLHPEMDRLLGSRDPFLLDLVQRYGRLRAAAGDMDAARPLAVWPEDPVLQRVLDALPRAPREAALRDRAGARVAVEEQASAPDEEGSVWGLSRYLVELHATRQDLAAAFPDLHDRGDAAGLLAWARGDGAVEVPERYRSENPWLDEADGPGGSAGAAAAPSAQLDDPEAEDAGAAEAAWLAGRGLGGVNVIGYFDEPALGVAEIARQVADGLERNGLPVQRVAVDRRGRPRPQDGDERLHHRVTINCVNADLLPLVRHRLRRRVRDDGLNVGLWWWELEELPPSWGPALELVHEVWAGSGFVGQAFRNGSDLPVRDVPLGLGSLPAPGPTPPEVAGSPYVLCVFDYASRIARKNPVGAVEAFRLAGLAADVRLVLKSVGGERHPITAERVRLAAAPLGDRVVLLDRELASEEQAALVGGAAAFLSVHRSEGLGLTIAEAMLRGVPVIATDYGGSTDLLDAETGWPVPWTPGAVPTECDPYPAGALWAEPDLAAAADALREVVAGGTPVEQRVQAARTAAVRRAGRIAEGTDLRAAAQAAIDRLDRFDREAWAAAHPAPEPQPRGLRARVGRRAGRERRTRE